MIYIKDKEIYIKAIKKYETGLNDQMIDAISFILTIINMDSSEKEQKSIIYSYNLFKYLKSSNNKNHKSYDLVIAALGDEIKKENIELIRSIVSMKISNDKTNVAKMPKKQLIKI